MNIGRVLVSILALAAMGTSVPAGANSWVTNVDGTGLTSGGLTSTIYCSATTCKNTTSGLSGYITLYAYSTPGPAATLSGTTPDTGSWLTAQMSIYGSSGVGITNGVQSLSTETNVPQHAIDNNGVNDILVIDFGSDYWDVSSFSLGYACNINTTTAGQCTATGTSANVNVDAWLGGTGNINFTQVQFSGGVPLAPGGSGTFTQLALSPDTGGTADTRNNNGATDTAVGRYLIVAGSLAQITDSFKLSALSATYAPPPPPGGHSVPLPGSAPLVVLGLLALTWASRRRAILRR